MRQPWIHSPAVDGIFILGIPFFIVAAVFFFPAMQEPNSMGVVSWAILVLGVDVSHVYSTLYRTYLDPETHARHRMFLYLLPFAVFVVCMILYSFGALVFWRVMAYLAVFHFARQQYGFMRVYARQEDPGVFSRKLDALAIYTATFFPIIDWHLAGQKYFNWFMKGDFFYAPHGGLRNLVFGVYLFIIGAYAIKEISEIRKKQTLNLPRNLLLLGTLLSWYVGIVHFNSDLAFTAINVMSHGIPYMALVWIWGNKKFNSRLAVPGATPAGGEPLEKKSSFYAGAVAPGAGGIETIFKPRYVALFIGSLLVLGYVEEGFWNIWVWHEREHMAFFAPFHRLFGDTETNSAVLKIVVPLLSVPQITHYVIDGFIWKIRRDSYNWRDITLASRGAPGSR